MRYDWRLEASPQEPRLARVYRNDTSEEMLDVEWLDTETGEFSQILRDKDGLCYRDAVTDGLARRTGKVKAGFKIFWQE